MSRVLLRSGKDPLTSLSPEASLARNGWGVFGGNVGNLLFISAVHRAVSVPGAEVVSDSLLTELSGVDEAYIDRINADFDVFVIPLANAFRAGFLGSLERLTRTIRRLKIPVVVVGVGCQLSLTGKVGDVPSRVSRAVKAFVGAVLDRSASIGLRGEITWEYLRGLGFPEKSLDVIGCPSLFHRGSELRIEKRVQHLTSESPIAINITWKGEQMGPIVAANTQRYANLVYIPQEHRELTWLLWGHDAQADSSGIPAYAERPLFEQDRVLFFVDASTWVRYLSTVEFAFGSRIHGNLAALMAGTPALGFAHDSRTLELAKYHHIPFREVRSLCGTEDAARLYDEADYAAFNAAHPVLFAAYRAFLDRNGINHIFTPGNENPEYDRRLAAIEFPPPVRGIMTNGQLDYQALLQRLRWLRQGAQTDKSRDTLGYRPPLEPPSAAPITMPVLLRAWRREQRIFAQLVAEVEARQSQVQALTEELSKLKEKVRHLSTLVESGARSTLRQTGHESAGATGP